MTFDPAVITTNPDRFHAWWQMRREPADRAIVAAAAKAGLLIKAGSLLFLTPAGKILRDQASQ